MCIFIILLEERDLLGFVIKNLFYWFFCVIIMLKRIVYTNLVLLLFSSVLIHAGSSYSVVPSDYLLYNVVDSSSTTNYFYGAWPPGHYFGTWSVEAGDKIMFNITSVTDMTINGTLTLGNVTFTDVRNIDIGSALALSIYPWMGGFIANSSDWTNIEQLVENTNTSISVEQITYSVNDNNITLIARIFEVSNYYGQYSKLIYDNNTGILLEGTTSFSNYRLSLSLEFTSVKLTAQTQKTLWAPILLSAFSVVIVAIILRKH